MKNETILDFINVFQAMNTLRRHLIISERAFTIEELVEKSNRNPSTTVRTEVLYFLVIFPSSDLGNSGYLT